MIADAPNSGARRGMSLCAVFLPSFTPVRSFTVTGISPSALFIPTTILPSFPAASSTVYQALKSMCVQEHKRMRTHTQSHCRFYTPGQ